MECRVYFRWINKKDTDMDEPKSITIIDFIENDLLPVMDGMIVNKYQYFVFPIICQSIELLGSFYDKNSLDKYGESETRFNNALKHLFKEINIKYGHNKRFFFKELRGNIIHQLRPSSLINFSSLTYDGMPKEMHLKESNGKTIMVVEQFVDDFKEAFARLRKKIDGKKSEINISRASEPFISIYSVTDFPPKVLEYFKMQNGNSSSTLTPCVSGKIYPVF